MLKFTKKTPQNTELASLIGKTEGAIRRYKKEDEAEYNKVLKKYKEVNSPFLTIEEYCDIKNTSEEEMNEKIKNNEVPYTHYIDGNNKSTIFVPSILEDYIDISNELKLIKPDTKTICISNFKGGVAKTTNSCNIAASLAYLGNRVLLVDADVQGNSTIAFGYSREDFKYTLVELITRLLEETIEDDLKESIINVDINQHFRNEVLGKLDILPNSSSSIYLAEDLPSFSRELGTMENTLKRVLEYVKNDYDYIIIDMPPRADLNLRMAIMASDYLIFSVTPEIFSEKGIPSLVLPVQKQQNIYKVENKKDFIVLGGINSRVRSNINLHSITTENSNKQLENLIGEYNTLFKTNISELNAIAEAQSGNGAVIFYQPTDKAVKLYFELTLEIIERIFTAETLRNENN